MERFGFPDIAGSLVEVLPPEWRPHALLIYAVFFALVAIIGATLTIWRRWNQGVKAQNEAEQSSDAHKPLTRKIKDISDALRSAKNIQDPAFRDQTIQWIKSQLLGAQLASATEDKQTSQDVTALVDSADPQEQTALALIAERRVAEAAAALLGDARKGAAQSAVQFARIGRLFFFRDTSSAVDAFEIATRLDPNDIDSRIRLGRLYANTGRSAEARALFMSAVAEAQRPEDKAEALTRLAAHVGHSGGATEAEDFALKAVAASEKQVAAGEPGARDRLAHALTTAGMVALRRGDVAGSARRMQSAIDIARALCAETGSPSSRIRLADALARASEIVRKASGIEAATRVALEAVAIAADVAKRDDAPPEARRIHFITLFFAGDITLNAGDKEAALGHLTQALAIARSLAAADLRDIQAQRDVAVVLVKLGDIDADNETGDHAKAEQHFTEVLRISQECLKIDPRDPQTQRDISLIYTRLGDLAKEAGNRSAAETHYLEALRIVQARAAVDAQDSEAQRDLSINLTRLGDVALEAGNREIAETRYIAALRLDQARAAADSRDLDAQRDVSVTLSRLGDLLLQMGNNAAAQVRFEEALAIDRARMTADPLEGQAKRDVSNDLLRLAEVASGRNDRAACDAYLAEALTLGKAAAAASDGGVADLARVMGRLAEVDQQRGNHESAHKNYEEAWKLLSGLCTKHPTSKTWRNDRDWYAQAMQRAASKRA